MPFVMPLMVVPSPNSLVVTKFLVPAKAASLMLTALLLLPTVEVMVSAMIAVNALVEPALMDLLEPLPLTPTVIPRLVFASTSVLRMLIAPMPVLPTVKLTVAAVLNVLATRIARLRNGEVRRLAPRLSVTQTWDTSAYLLGLMV